MTTAVLCFLLVACGGGRKSEDIISMKEPPLQRVLDCSVNLNCEEIQVIGHPFSKRADGGTSFFRGYADPDLEYDPVTNQIWMAYSWLQNLNPLARKKLVGGVESHLARLRGGRFEHVKVLKRNQRGRSSKGKPGWFNHEVTSLVRRSNGRWEAMWLSYHKGEEGKAYEGGPFLTQTLGQGPRDLGARSVPLLAGKATAASYGARYRLSDIPQVSKCQMFTEPAHLVYQGQLYLGVNCMRFGLFGRIPKEERFVLFREKGGRYEFVADVLTYRDAQNFYGAERMEQVDFFVKRNGAVGMVVTPMKKHMHLGCHFMEFSDFAQGRLKRDTRGVPVVDLIIKDKKSKPAGNGACTYHRKYDGGVMIVRRVLPPVSRTGVTFTMYKTGIHP